MFLLMLLVRCGDRPQSPPVATETLPAEFRKAAEQFKQKAGTNRFDEVEKLAGLLRLTNATNVLSISNAVKIASGLRIGMRGADAQKYMQEHGMSQTNVYSLSLDRGMTSICPYPLAGEDCLMLQMESSRVGPGMFDWGNPVLLGAYILQGTNVISITLTNQLAVER